MTSKESSEPEVPKWPVFDRESLVEHLKCLQAKKFNLKRVSSAITGPNRSRDLKVLPVPHFKLKKLEKYPLLTSSATYDPNDIGTTGRDGFDDGDNLVRRPIRLDKEKRFITISLARRLALANQVPWPGRVQDHSNQLVDSVQTSRLRFIAELLVARSRELRRQGCLQFSNTASYCRNLYCRPPETPHVGEVHEACGMLRLCPWCWIRTYVTRVFFGLRGIMLDRVPEKDGFELRDDYKLVVVRQCWTRPITTHPFDLLNELTSRRDELLRETPSRRSIKGLAQLQFIEPPMRRRQPWRLHRRALFVCDVSQGSYGYPHNAYDVRNDSWTFYAVKMRQLAAAVGRTFDYPMAMQLAPTHLVRRLLDAYRLWPYDSSNGFHIFNSRGCINRAQRKAKEERYA